MVWSLFHILWPASQSIFPSLTFFICHMSRESGKQNNFIFLPFFRFLLFPSPILFLFPPFSWLPFKLNYFLENFPVSFILFKSPPPPLHIECFIVPSQWGQLLPECMPPLKRLNQNVYFLHFLHLISLGSVLC